MRRQTYNDILKTTIVIILATLGYLYLLNGRYSHIRGFYYFEKWANKAVCIKPPKGHNY